MVQYTHCIQTAAQNYYPHHDCDHNDRSEPWRPYKTKIPIRLCMKEKKERREGEMEGGRRSEMCKKMDTLHNIYIALLNTIYIHRYMLILYRWNATAKYLEPYPSSFLKDFHILVDIVYHR